MPSLSRPLSFRRIAVLLAAGLGALYVYFAAELYFNQASHVYHPKKEWKTTPASENLSFKELALTASDGVRLSAWYIPSAASQGTVLVCHGNSRNMSSDMDVITMFHALGYHVLILDYRGYGKSEGRPDEQGTYRDAQAAWDWLIQRESPERIVICGRSLGGAIAVELASRNTPRALMIEGAFTSLPEIGQQRYPYFPIRLLSRFSYDTLSHLKHLYIPVLIIHSRDDEIIPFQHARRLYEAAHDPKTLLEIGGPHKGGYKPTLQKYYNGVEAFLKSVH